MCGGKAHAAAKCSRGRHAVGKLCDETIGALDGTFTIIHIRKPIIRSEGRKLSSSERVNKSRTVPIYADTVMKAYETMQNALSVGEEMINF